MSDPATTTDSQNGMPETDSRSTPAATSWASSTKVPVAIVLSATATRTFRESVRKTRTSARVYLPRLRIFSARRNSTGRNEMTDVNRMTVPSTPLEKIRPVVPRKLPAEMNSPAMANPFCQLEIERPAAKNPSALFARRDAAKVTHRVREMTALQIAMAR